MAKPFRKALEILRTVAPTAAAALGGPMGPLAAKVIRDVLGTEPDADIDEAVLAAAADPDAVVKLKEIEATMKAKEAELGVEFERIAAEDRASARARQVALKDNMPGQVFYITSFGFFGTLGLVFAYGVPETGGEVLLSMVGSLGTVWIASAYYFVGSSAGSARKTDILAKSS